MNLARSIFHIPPGLLPIVFSAVLVSGLQAAENKLPLLWLPFEEGKGTFADDISPNQIEAVLSNVAWVRGKFGTAVRFNGENSYIDLPAIKGLNGAGEFTISLWALWEDSGRQYPNLISSTNWSPGGLMLFVNDESCSFRIGHTATNPETPGNEWKETGVSLLDQLPQREWVHLCVTFSKPEIKTYVNGTLVSQGTWEHLPAVERLRLGAWQSSVSHRGLIDDVRIEDRALLPEQVKALATDPTRKDAAFEVLDDTPGKVQQTWLFDNGQVVLSLDDTGRAVSLRHKDSGSELLSLPSPLVTVTLDDGRILNARKVTRQNEDLVFHFPRGGKVVIGLSAQVGFHTFIVRSIDIPDASSLTFCQLEPSTKKYVGTMANMLSDDEFGVCLRGYELPVEMSVSPRRLTVGTTKALGLIGYRAGLAAGARKDLPGILRAMAEHAGVPTSTLCGPWALGAEENRGSYLFADLSHAATDDWIDLAKRGGFSTIHLHGWWSSLGHYEPNRGYFPEGMDDMADSIRRIKEAGLRTGIHTLTACIDTHDPWITPVPSEDLIPFVTYTLDQTISATDTALHVKELPAEVHDTVFTYSGNGNAIRIGKEIIQYSRISREKPYAFLDCKRGAFGTMPSAHDQGARADYLQQRYLAFYPQPDSPLADALADRIAAIYNEGGVDNIYFDGSEGMMSRYGIDVMRHKIFKRLKGSPLAEASCHGQHNWWVHSRLGAWDHPVWGAKRFHDEHVAAAAAYRKSDLLEPQMGWWAPRQASAIARGHFPDEMEYFGVKNLGLDAAMSIQGVNVSHAPLSDGVEAQITLLGWYERLRLARYFDQQTLDRISVPGAEFRLRQAKNGQWQFTPVAMETMRVGTSTGGTTQWTSRNNAAAQPLSFRLEALHSATPYASADRLALAGENDFSRFKGASSSSVKLAIGEITDDTKGGARNLTFKARNVGTSTKGAWASASLSFPDPYRNLKDKEALGLWVRGDGKGALLNLQLGTPREHLSALSDHQVKLDFKGWRYIEILLRERDTSKLHDHIWPYYGNQGGSHALYRNPVQMQYVSHVSVYLNDLPTGQDIQVAISPIMALTTKSVELENPELDVNGGKFTIPFTLRSGEYAELEPDGVCSHYNVKGELVERRISATSEVPSLVAGENTITYACRAAGAGATRAEVSVNHFSEPFGGVNPASAGSKYLHEEYEMPRRIISPAGKEETWNLSVRPDQKSAKLEIEISGEVENPTLEIGGRRIAFPVKLLAEQRLVCRDGANWTVTAKNRRVVSRGILGTPPAVLTGGSHQVRFTSSACNRPLVKLTKLYTQ